MTIETDKLMANLPGEHDINKIPRYEALFPVSFTNFSASSNDFRQPGQAEKPRYHLR